MTDSTEYLTDRLAKLVEAKLSCLTQLRDLSSKQLDLIRRSEMSVLMNVLAAKQRTLTTLQRLEAAIDPYRDENPEERPWRTPELRSRCSENNTRCDTLLQEIVKIEKESEATLVSRQAEVSHALQGMHAASEARGAYADDATEPGGGIVYEA